MNQNITPSANRAPRGFQVFFGVFLPPGSREQILGDLEEIYRGRAERMGRLRALLLYLVDAAPIAVAMVWAQRKHFYLECATPEPVPPGIDFDSLRRRAEGFQYSNYFRVMFYAGMISVMSVVLTCGVSLAIATQTGESSLLGRTLLVACFIGILWFTVYLHHRRGGAHTVPGGLSFGELVAFHRAELSRRRDFLRSVWYWKLLPMMFPVLVEVIVQGKSRSTILAIYVGTIAYTFFMGRSVARKVEREIENLPRPV